MLKANINEALVFLNQLIQRDAEAIRALILTKVPCTQALAEHPTVQVCKHSDGTYEVGLLGILNGMFSTRSPSRQYVIAAIFAVVCPNGHFIPNGATVEDACNVCNAQLVLGRLERFVKYPLSSSRSKRSTKNVNSP